MDRNQDSRERKRQNRVDAGIAQHGGGGAAERAGTGSLAEAAVVGALAGPPPASALPPDRVEPRHVREDRAELHDEDPQVVQPEPIVLMLFGYPALRGQADDAFLLLAMLRVQGVEAGDV